MRERAAKLKERCSDGVEDQEAKEAVWGQARMITSVLEAVSRASQALSFQRVCVFFAWSVRRELGVKAERL